MGATELALTFAMALTSPTDPKMEKLVPVTEATCNAIGGILYKGDIICIFRQEVGKDDPIMAVPMPENRCSIQDLSGNIIIEVTDKNCNQFLEKLAQTRRGHFQLVLQKIKSLFFK